MYIKTTYMLLDQIIYVIKATYMVNKSNIYAAWATYMHATELHVCTIKLYICFQLATYMLLKLRIWWIKATNMLRKQNICILRNYTYVLLNYVYANLS